MPNIYITVYSKKKINSIGVMVVLYGVLVIVLGVMVVVIGVLVLGLG